MLLATTLLFMASIIHAQAPTVTWDDHYPIAYETDTYSAEVIKESAQGGFVVIGSRRIASQTNPYHEVLLLHINENGGEIGTPQTFGGINYYGIPWDQEAYDMVFTPEGNYLITGYRDTTSNKADSPAGLLLMEITPNGTVLFDSLYYNHNMDVMMGRSIQPAIGGGYIIVGSILEDGGGTERGMMITMKKDDNGIYNNTSLIEKFDVGDNGYPDWVRPFADGYLLGGSAFNGDNKFDLFARRLTEGRFAAWTKHFGAKNQDGFTDATISHDTAYLAGYADVPVGGTSFNYDQIYVVKIDGDGEIIWEKTYGGPSQHYANSIMITGDGNLMVAGTAYDFSMHTDMVLLKIDAATGDSLWMESYGSFVNSATSEAIRTGDFGYLVAGRASYTAAQDPRIYAMKLDNASTANLFLAKEDLNLDIVTGTPTKDVIDVTADKVGLFGICVKIESLLHPAVGDLELTLEHDGTTVTLVDQPFHSGENFIKTALIDAAEMPVESGFAPYTGWWQPEEPLFPFLYHSPTGEWTLTVTDHGDGGLKATSRILVGWSLNLLTESGAGTGVSTQQMLANFGLEQIRPNPINQEAFISFRIAAPGPVKLKVYNQVGQLVEVLCDEKLPEGRHERMWQPGSMAPGTYFFHLESGGMISVRKAVLAR